MNPDDIIRLLDELGRRLGPTGEYVFALAVRQVITESLVWGGIGAVLVLVPILGARPVYRFVMDPVHRKSCTYCERDVAGFIAAIIGGLALLVGVMLLASSIPVLLNPEYSAMERLLRMLNP